MDEPAPLSDSALDRAVEEVLRVEPSPEFLARIRERIAAEPSPRRWWRRTELAGAAAGLVVALAIWGWPGRDDETPDRSVSMPAATNAPVGPAAERWPGTDPETPLVAALPRVRTRARASVAEDPFPVVILAENERKALQWLGAETRIEPSEPAEIVVSTQRAGNAWPALPPLSLDAPEMGQPVFYPVALE